MQSVHRRHPPLLGALGLLWLTTAMLLLTARPAGTSDLPPQAPEAHEAQPPTERAAPRGIRPPWREHWIPDLSRPADGSSRRRMAA